MTVCWAAGAGRRACLEVRRASILGSRDTILWDDVKSKDRFEEKMERPKLECGRGVGKQTRTRHRLADPKPSESTRASANPLRAFFHTRMVYRLGNPQCFYSGLIDAESFAIEYGVVFRLQGLPIHHLEFRRLPQRELL